LTNTYLNIPRARHEWRQASFQGQIVVGDFQYASGATVPTAAFYYQADTNAKTLTTLGTDTFDPASTANNHIVSRRTQFIGRVHSTSLGVGQSDTANFTVRVLAPAGTADEQQREVITYNGNEEITLPGGRLTACKLTNVLSSVSGGTVTELSQEQTYLAKDIGVVKSYYKPTAAVFILDRNQTKLTELVSTTGSVTFASSAAATTPSLASCGAMAAGQDLVLTASNLQDATS
jgi:hypothetical protein